MKIGSRENYEDRKKKLSKRYDEIKTRIAGIQETKEDRKREKYQINLFTEQFETLSEPLTEFDDQLFRTIVRYITIL